MRFRTPDEGHSTFTDVIRGEVSVAWSTISDFVIVRSNGTPVFFLANALDDLDMDITHVLRGEDLIDSTHRVLALRRALGHNDQPVYAHLPLILGPGGGKLSKRHGAVSVEEYRDGGYLPSALVNYLALLGWGPEDGREVLTIDELVAEFDLERVNSSAATFDPKKLEWMNGEHIRALPLNELVSAVLPFARDRYRNQLDIPRFERAVQLAQSARPRSCRSPTRWPSSSSPTTSSRSIPRRGRSCRKSRPRPPSSTRSPRSSRDVDWSDEIDVRPAIEGLGLKAGKVMHVVYTAVEGRSSGLPLFPRSRCLVASPRCNGSEDAREKL